MKHYGPNKHHLKVSVVRIIVSVMLCAVLLFFFASYLILRFRIYYKPWSLYDSVWVSEDYDITIKIYSDNLDGTILYDNTELQIHCWPSYEFLYIYVPDSNDRVSVPIVDFKCWYYAEDEFSAKVIETYVPYFEVGQKITFRCVD